MAKGREGGGERSFDVIVGIWLCGLRWQSIIRTHKSVEPETEERHVIWIGAETHAREAGDADPAHEGRRRRPWAQHGHSGGGRRRQARVKSGRRQC